MSQWIKCSDRLPEIGVEVLLRIPVCGSFNVEGGSYRGDGVWFGAWCGTHGAGKSYKVTQWAPAPEEPACCTPTADEQKLLAEGSYTPEELWGGSRPTCPKCFGK